LVCHNAVRHESASETPSYRSVRRDGFVDAWRGYALVAITLNHFGLVAHDEGLTNIHSFTLTPLGLSSGAEIFMLCSGYAFGLAYGRVLERSGPARCMAKAARRAALLLICNLLMTLMSAGMIALAIPAARRDASSFVLARYVFEDFGAVLAMMARLQWTPAYHDVLPLYVLLLLAAPVLLLWLRRMPLLAWVVSAGTWLVATTGLVTTGTIGLPTWYFHPMAWQFLFFLGMAGAEGRLLERLPCRRLVLPTCGALLAAALALKLAVHHGLLPSVADADGMCAVPLASKLVLGPLRIAHAVVLALWVAALYRRLPWAARLGGPVARQGRKRVATGLCRVQPDYVRLRRTPCTASVTGNVLCGLCLAWRPAVGLRFGLGGVACQAARLCHHAGRGTGCCRLIGL
jgi:hypothetical protein